MRNHQLIATLEARVETHIQEAVMVFQNLDEKVLLQPSPTGGWSIAQCLWHLNSYGHYYLPRIKDKLSRAKLNPADTYFRSGLLGGYFTRLMEPGENMKKIAAFKDHRPGTHLNAFQEVAEFIQQQETLIEYLRLAAQTDMNQIRIPISISKLIRLKLGDVLQFLVAHNERHIQQAKRNVPMSGKT